MIATEWIAFGIGAFVGIWVGVAIVGVCSIAREGDGE